MRKKVKKTKKIKSKGPTLMDKLPKNHGEWLFLCINFTKRSLTNPELESQRFLIHQINRLASELFKWENANPTAHIRDLFDLYHKKDNA